MFALARTYRDRGMAAYASLQQAEFAFQADAGYEAVKHQRFVGTGYFDQVAQCVAAGQACTGALAGSTEEAQFAAAAPAQG
jgi:isocitrate lyase